MNRPLRIAIADDEPDTREFFERYLPRMGHQVVASAEDGRRLVELCRACRPDMIITDIRMPGMNGLDAVGELFREQTVPVIVVTAHADPQWVEQAQAVGAFGYPLKPITERELGPASPSRPGISTCSRPCGRSPPTCGKRRRTAS